MGRVKATKLTGKFYLRTDRNPDKNGKYAIYLDYVLGNVDLLIYQEVAADHHEQVIADLSDRTGKIYEHKPVIHFIAFEQIRLG